MERQPVQGMQIQGVEAIQESIKTLRTNIEFAGMDKKIKSVLITSAVSGEGKSTISINLALSMADMGRSTLIVENDFRRPMLGKQLGVRPDIGLVDVLNQTAVLDEAITDTTYPNLYFLGVGGFIGNPVEVLASKKYEIIIENLKTMYDFVIFDAPPIGTIIDGALISPHVDGVLIVIRAGTVDPPQVKNVVAQLEKSGARILGAVLNDVDHTRVNYGYYRYGYDYGSRVEKKGFFSRFGRKR